MWFNNLPMILRSHCLLLICVQMTLAETDPESSDPLPHPLHTNGVFANPWKSWNDPKMMDVFRFWFATSHSNIPNAAELDQTLPVLQPVISDHSEPDAIRVTWIGHATALVQFENVTLLTCPIFSDRASPNQLMGPKRYRPTPVQISQLPKTLNAVLISHNHYDHLDLNTVKQLHKQYGNQISWFVGSGLKKWFNEQGVTNVHEMNWWQEIELKDVPEVRVVFLPAQHWSKRTLTDTNKSLWGSFAVIGQTFRYYHAGDTGYNDNIFKQIGNMYGPFHLATIPIGAYEPRWFLKYQHVDPEEATAIHQDIRSQMSIAIHWGTFDLSKEFYLEPRTKLVECLQAKQIPLDSFITVAHGETRLVYSNGTSVKQN